MHIDQVISGECQILYLRRTQTPDQSLMTLQVSKGRVVHAEGSHRRELSPDELEFLNDWGAEKNIQIAV